MDNGHIHPSGYALRLESRTDHPVTHTDIVDELRRRHPGDWPALLGTIFVRCRASMLAL